MKQTAKNPRVKFEKSEHDNQWYWNQTAKNGKETADGSEGYKTLTKCKDGYLSTIANAIHISIRYTGEIQYYFNVKFAEAKELAGRNATIIEVW